METSQTETYKSMTAVSWELFGFTFSGQEAAHFIFCLSLYKNLTSQFRGHQTLMVVITFKSFINLQRDNTHVQDTN